MIFDFTSIIDNKASLGMIFIYGLLTSIHCISMCGGLVLSGSISAEENKKEQAKGIIGYNLGRVLSYTSIGAVAGALGSVVVLSSWLKGMIPIISGLLILLIGLNFIGIFSKFKLPVLRLDKLAKKLFSSRNMILIGLATGLFPCAPMQVVQLYSLASGSVGKGALAMLLFALGTVPCLLLFSYFSFTLQNKFKKYILKISAIVLILLGASMIQRGLTLCGVDVLSFFKAQGRVVEATVRDDYQVLFTELDDNGFPDVELQKGIPVKWVINVDKKYVGECFATIEIPEYNVRMELKEGENIIEFTPTKEGESVYNSWCGMYSGTITIQ